ncbi:MAG: serine/threonine protein kinase [Pseudonocardia sp.]|nr:serine/threonine protein kinase [Pseudonocardia sp.]
MSAGDELAGRYRLQELIGRGAMGEVWLAEDQLLHRTVAVKKLLAERATGDDPTHAERVMREARIAGRLSHPNAAAVHDLVVADGVPCVVMEYVKGQSLGARIRERGPLPPPEAARIIADVAGALAAAHAAGIVHRDVKPDNVLIAEDGTAKLVDFGIAKAGEDAGLTQTGMTIGTPSYIAPEVARGGVPAPSADIWSLGTTLYTAVEGHPPFGGSNEGALAVLSRVVSDPIPPPQHAGALTPTIMRMLDRDPNRRPSATSVRTLLNAAAGATGTGTDGATMVGIPLTTQTRVNVPGRGSTQPIPVMPPPVGPVGPPAVMPRPLGYQQPPTPPQRQRSNDALLATVAVIVVLIVVAGIVIALLVRNNGSASPTTTPTVTPPTHSTPTTPSSTPTTPTTEPTTPTTEPTTPSTTPTTPTTEPTTPTTTPTTPSTTPTTPTTEPSTPSSSDSTSFRISIPISIPLPSSLRVHTTRRR